MQEEPMSNVLEHPALSPSAAAVHFRNALAHATDPSDVHSDLERNAADFVVLDARSPEAFARGHVPGAINIPHRRIDARSTADLSKERLIVTYCDGAGCNASTKAALKLAELGFGVKEMLGGIDWWRRDGYAIETGGTSACEVFRNVADEATGNVAGEAAENVADEATENAVCGC
jgi:rhodanese-related sulfurtransferase